MTSDQLDEIARAAFERHNGRPHPWEGALPWVIAAMTKRASNREASARNLAAAGIPFESKNNGAHLIVSAPGLVVDFWPGTGLWAVRGTNERRRGVRQLITRLRGSHPPLNTNQRPQP